MLSRETGINRRNAVVPLRPLTACVLAAVALLVAGCGDGSTEPDEPISTGDVNLVVTLDPDGPEGEAEPQTGEVTCDENESEPDCAAAGKLDAVDMAPADEDQACTELFGGPDVLRVEGDLDGVEVDYTLTRENGCEIKRFDAAVPLAKALFDDYEPGSAIAG